MEICLTEISFGGSCLLLNEWILRFTYVNKLIVSQESWQLEELNDCLSLDKVRVVRVNDFDDLTVAHSVLRLLIMEVHNLSEENLSLV